MCCIRMLTHALHVPTYAHADRRGMDWYDTPDYAWMKSKVEEAMFERNYVMDYAFDWGNRVLPKKKVFGLF